MNIYDFYITPEEYERAKENGISKKTLDSRIRDFKWDKEKAINTPSRKCKKYSKEIKELARKNGISISTFKSRVNQLGWSQIEAATTPVMDKTKNIYKAIPKITKYPPPLLEKVKQNNIPVKCFYNRVRECKWDIEKAATTPVMTLREIGLLSKDQRAKEFDYIFCKNQYGVKR